MTTDTEALRQKFERHIVATGRSDGELIFEAGHYLYPDVQEIWELYQAGHAAAKAENAEQEQAKQRDAERYSWLRMNRLWLKANLPTIAAPAFDAAIDAAIDAAKGER